MKHKLKTDGKKMEGWSIGVMAGKWTGFPRLETALTRLFPHKSTQVVDFPRMAMVSIFWEGAKNSRISGRGIQAELGTKMGKWSAGVLEYWESGEGKGGSAPRIFAGKSAGCYALFRGSARKFAQIRAVIPRLFGLLRVGAFFNHGWTGMNTDGKRRWTERCRSMPAVGRSRSIMDMENGGPEGGWRRVLTKNGCAQLHVFTRIYTLLHNVLFR